MLVAVNSESDLPIFPLLNPASKHDSHGFLETYFRMKSFLPDYHVRKWILYAAHDAMPYYAYCRNHAIQPFIDLNGKRGIKVSYKDDFTIGKDGVPVCKAGRKMNRDGLEPSKYRQKYRCPLASRKYGCSCENPCSNSKYGRTVHRAMNDNSRLINFPPRDSKEWKLEYNAGTSTERSNKLKYYTLFSGIATVMSFSHTHFSLVQIIFTFQSSIPEFAGYNHSGFREIIPVSRQPYIRDVS